PYNPLWPAFQRFPRLPKPIEHTRPRGRLQASCLSLCGPAFGCSILFRQNCPCPYPLVWNHPNDAIGFAKLRAGTNGPKKSSGYAGMALLGALRAQKTKNQKPKTKNQKPKTKNQKIFRPQAAKKRFKLLRFFPAHSGQPAAEKRR